MSKDQGKLKDAESELREVLSLLKRMDREDHTYYLAALNNLASVLGERGKFSEAVRTYEKAVENIAETVGKEHLYYGFTLTNMAFSMNLKGDHEQAIETFKAAKPYKLKTVGKDHPLYAFGLVQQADSHLRIGQNNAAKRLLSEAKDTLEKGLPEGHHRRLVYNSIRGAHMAATGKKQAGIAMMRKAYEALVEKKGEDDLKYTKPALQRLNKAISQTF